MNQTYEQLAMKINSTRDKLKIVTHVLEDDEYNQDMNNGAVTIVWECFDLLDELRQTLKGLKTALGAGEVVA